ncbi:MAG: DUF6776 family protein [Burkholderiaceae bacterium]
MRWKLLRRRLSISAPRMIVRSHLPWPLRWAVIALMFGFSAALALWAFEFGKDIAGLDRSAKSELADLRVEVSRLREEREKALSTANIAESLLTTEKAAQETLVQNLRRLEAENVGLKSNLGFFEKLLPANANSNAGLIIRGLRAEMKSAGNVKYQMLLMQPGKAAAEFAGRYEVTLAGTLDGKPWNWAHPAGVHTLQLKQYLRVEGTIECPVMAVVETVSVKVTDKAGSTKAAETVKL